MNFDLAKDGCMTASKKKCNSDTIKISGSATGSKQQQITNLESGDLNSNAKELGKSAPELKQKQDNGLESEEFLSCI